MSDTETTVGVIFTGGEKAVLAEDNGSGQIAMQSVPRIGGAVVDTTNPFPTKDVPSTLVAGTTAIVTTSGVPVVAITGPVRGGYIKNPFTSTAQGLTPNTDAVPLYYDPVNAPGNSESAANGTTDILYPGTTWVIPGPIPTGSQVRVNSTQSGHKFVVVIWS